MPFRVFSLSWLITCFTNLAKTAKTQREMPRPTALRLPFDRYRFTNLAKTQREMPRATALRLPFDRYRSDYRSDYYRATALHPRYTRSSSYQEGVRGPLLDTNTRADPCVRGALLDTNSKVDPKVDTYGGLTRGLPPP